MVKEKCGSTYRCKGTDKSGDYFDFLAFTTPGESRVATTRDTDLRGQIELMELFRSNIAVTFYQNPTTNLSSGYSTGINELYSLWIYKHGK